MRDIYAASAETIVYLGDDDNGNTSIAAWNFLQRHSEWAADEFGNKDYEIPSMLENNLLDFRGDMYDIDIDVLPRPWFTRS
ncbi:hypothetical protein C8035_v010873 [Colletotrichum spinosum]|uniref:Uncharacterized protein n=1 Tax=Colletotrichum spinosum TaxID=1347390 RepID=A0A4R8Q976_9PEZI|nr:hypothetical protein C8035_v010873 [Colletotrichum spinosum]